MARKIMGAKRSFRSPNGGGIPSFMLPFIIAGVSVSSSLSCSIVANFQTIGANFRQKGAKVNFFLLAFVFSRENRRPKRAKSKHIFERWEGRQGVEVVGCLTFGVPTCAEVGRASRLQDLPECRRLSSGGVFPAFCPLVCFTPEVLGLNMALFGILRAFLAWFGVFVWVCIAWVLCAACVAFVRVNS